MELLKSPVLLEYPSLLQPGLFKDLTNAIHDTQLLSTNFVSNIHTPTNEHNDFPVSKAPALEFSPFLAVVALHTGYTRGMHTPIHYR